MTDRGRNARGAEGRPASEHTLTLDVSILGRDYKIACKEDERAELADAVALLDERMRAIRDSGKVGGIDRIAVMAALNIAHDLLRERKKPAPDAGASVDAQSAERRIRDMSSAIERALAGQQ